MRKTDFIVIGSGIAGLNAARILADFGLVIIITKGKLQDSATQYAQGGIAAVSGDNDSIKQHITDTLEAGRHHNNKDAVRFLSEHSGEAISELAALGVAFDKNPDNTYMTSFEAGHTYPRIFHATDFTGQVVEQALISVVTKHRNIDILQHTYATELLVKDNQCFGVYAGDDVYLAKATVLATGGVGQLYQWTTNPYVATGDGIAIAHRAGAAVTDLEFVQFHPTALKENQSPLFLLSEALRGEGALLIDAKGNRFMERFKHKELEPRDVVSRAIFEKQQEGDVYLDIRHKGKTFLQQRFPNTYEVLEKKGFDLATDLIPVTPAAHFMCGGVVTDLYGRTSVDRLFAYGEVAATGVHGANRLASNSLLEGFVFSSQIKHCIPNIPTIPNIVRTTGRGGKYFAKHDQIQQIRQIMWNYVGIERTHKGIKLAIEKLTALEKQGNSSFAEKNMLQTALLIAKAAYKREKSLGVHYLID